MPPFTKKIGPGQGGECRFRVVMSLRAGLARKFDLLHKVTERAAKANKGFHCLVGLARPVKPPFV